MGKNGVLLWADMNAATSPGSRGRSALGAGDAFKFPRNPQYGGLLAINLGNNYIASIDTDLFRHVCVSHHHHLVSGLVFFFFEIYFLKPLIPFAGWRRRYLGCYHMHWVRVGDFSH